MYEREKDLLKKVSNFAHSLGGCNDPLIREIKPIIKPLHEKLEKLISTNKDSNSEAIDKAYQELFAAFEQHKDKVPTSETSTSQECLCHDKSEAELASLHSFMRQQHQRPPHQQGAEHSFHSSATPYHHK